MLPVPLRPTRPGRHRAPGLTGSPRRFAAIVALLVTLASLPVLAVLNAGATSLARTSAVPPGPAVPFLPPPSPAPVVLGPPVVVLVPYRLRDGG
ncbi:hypothetical protein [Catenuloplanes atrovinosus]|uniref:Uncharacterized protein n=1 Tax=Catenuloplanes atrovinosus TaxID=137266 RepID=A0AAE3YY51_9ACTN|nr:hypothetical protein [Catenuloplanes atrovinosus]MDR7280146.1 hypothetical protein [Catenuloplanes atrovinosus]